LNYEDNNNERNLQTSSGDFKSHFALVDLVKSVSDTIIGIAAEIL
jgi:hypothetical protein